MADRQHTAECYRDGCKVGAHPLPRPGHVTGGPWTPEEVLAGKHLPMTAAVPDPRDDIDWSAHRGSCRVFYAERRCTCGAEGVKA